MCVCVCYCQSTMELNKIHLNVEIQQQKPQQQETKGITSLALILYGIYNIYIFPLIRNRLELNTIKTYQKQSKRLCKFTQMICRNGKCILVRNQIDFNYIRFNRIACKILSF